jgi:hypothetical protein
MRGPPPATWKGRLAELPIPKEAAAEEGPRFEFEGRDENGRQSEGVFEFTRGDLEKILTLDAGHRIELTRCSVHRFPADPDEFEIRAAFCACGRDHGYIYKFDLFCQRAFSWMLDTYSASRAELPC